MTTDSAGDSALMRYIEMLLLLNQSLQRLDDSQPGALETTRTAVAFRMCETLYPQNTSQY